MATTYRLVPVDQPTAPPLEISARLRSQLVYFMTPPDDPQVPPLQPNDYWIEAQQTADWLADGVLEVVSPLDDEHRTSIELSEEQEAFLAWLATYGVQHIRLQEVS
jgi:hypothetical protein